MRRLEWPPSLPRSSSCAPSPFSRSVKDMPSSISSVIARRALLDDAAHHVLPAKPRAGLERIAHVEVERVLVRGHAGDAALRVVGVRLRAVLLRDDRDRPALRHVEREGQPGDARAEHDEVVAVMAGSWQTGIVLRLSASRQK